MPHQGRSAPKFPAVQQGTPSVTSDEFKYYEQVLRRVFGYELVHVQVHNPYRRDRIIRSTSRLVSGQDWKLEYAEARSEDSKRHNTAYIERLNLYIRFACSYLRRRTPAPMKKPQKLTDAIALLRTFYNFIRPHSSLKFGRVKRTPAMQAEIFPRALTFLANQVRVLLTSTAYVLYQELRAALRGTELGRGMVATLRLKLLKIGATISESVRRVVISMPSAHPWKDLWIEAAQRVNALT